MAIGVLEAILLTISVCLSVSVDCRPQDPSKAQILRYDFNLGDSGNFDFNVDTTDGFHHDASGYLENAGAEDEGIVVRGSYSYTGPDGVLYTITYTADKNGFQPIGKHIPEIGTPLTPVVGSGGVGGGFGGGYSCTATLCGTGLG